MPLKFSVYSFDGDSRLGRLETAHGRIDTPAFMPVGTVGTIKAMLPESVKATGAQILLSNTYHLMLRPGSNTIEKLGGLHNFMGWNGPILTDSGGYQVMSLSTLRQLDEDGVRFRSHIDGSYHTISPESSISIQRQIGSDISMAFDECTPYPIDKSGAAKSMALSMRWAKRSKQAFQVRPGYGLFGIVQGSIFDELRLESASILKGLDLDGYAVGGLAVGEGQSVMLKVLDITLPTLPKFHPRYLMGVGKPDDIVQAVCRGIDMFDCVLPTRSGRTGQAFTRRGQINLRNARHSNDQRPIDCDCNCPACRSFSRSYLNHLVKSGEILGAMLLTWHNLHYYQMLMSEIREAIYQQNFHEFRKQFFENWLEGDIPEI